MFTILEQSRETPTTWTVKIDGSMTAAPGQFAMVWVPGVDEFPMSLSYTEGQLGITYQMIGEGTKALSKMSPREAIGIRGPYGNGFSIRGKKLLVVGGGTGMAPLGPFIEQAIGHGATVTAAIGAKTAAELLFEARSRKAGADVSIATDDGTKGFKGLATELASRLVERNGYDTLYACGPEKMVAGLFQIAKRNGIAMQASLERIMKCGIGICDSCALDGKHVCRDGPVFSDKDLASFEQLGKSRLDPTGRKVKL